MKIIIIIYIPMGMSCYLGTNNAGLVVASGAGWRVGGASRLCEELTGGGG